MKIEPFENIEQAVSQCRILTERNAKLAADHDSLISQMRPSEQAFVKTDSMKGTPTKGLLSRFGKSLRKRYTFHTRH